MSDHPAAHDAVAVKSVEAWAVRAPIAVPVRSSFGIMSNRPAVFMRVADHDGHVGWGEAWCNFPPVGAEHRARLANELIGPSLVSLGETPVNGVFDRLIECHRIMVLQSGEWGPFRQVAAALDIACHDLGARRAKVPLWHYLGGSGDTVAAYASGIAAADLGQVVPSAQREGHIAFKLKIGFGDSADLAAIEKLKRLAGTGARLMVDANQAWTLDAAVAIAAKLQGFGLTWLEEPLAADASLDDWRQLALRETPPIAAGENMNGDAEFAAAIASGAFAYIQPDAAKWGGLSGCRRVALSARGANQTYCPHFLGGGIGLLASAHLLAAVGGPGLLEIDTNPNPWRERLVGASLRLEAGYVSLGEQPGLGIDPAGLDLGRA